MCKKIIYGFWIWEQIQICNALQHELNSKLNETKYQFRIRSTKRSHSELLMAPKLPTSQLFKGRAYELKYRAYRFCLNKKQANLLLYLGAIFSKLEKIITYLKFARIQTLLHSECIKNTTVEFTLRRSFSALQRRTPSFLIASHVPLMFL